MVYVHSSADLAGRVRVYRLSFTDISVFSTDYSSCRFRCPPTRTISTSAFTVNRLVPLLLLNNEFTATIVDVYRARAYTLTTTIHYRCCLSATVVYPAHTTFDVVVYESIAVVYYALRHDYE